LHFPNYNIGKVKEGGNGRGTVTVKSTWVLGSHLSVYNVHVFS